MWCSDYVVEGQVALSCDSIFSVESKAFLAMSDWMVDIQSDIFGTIPPMLKEFRDSLNREFLLQYFVKLF